MIEVLGENHGCHKQKNEGAFEMEWIAYHKTIGFTDIVILSNDCEDGSGEMLDHLSKSGEIIHLRNDDPYGDRGMASRQVCQGNEGQRISRFDGAFVDHAPLTTHAHPICHAIAPKILESPQSWPFRYLVRE